MCIIMYMKVEMELKEVGRMLAEARKLRGMSRVDLANRVGVDRRTLTQLEKGSAQVSIGLFFQVLHVLNLLSGITEVVRPENDLEGIAAALRRARRRKPSAKKISDEKVNF